jgi:hypothetical protein
LDLNKTTLYNCLSISYISNHDSIHLLAIMKKLSWLIRFNCLNCTFPNIPKKILKILKNSRKFLEINQNSRKFTKIPESSSNILVPKMIYIFKTTEILNSMILNHFCPCICIVKILNHVLFPSLFPGLKET